MPSEQNRQAIPWWPLIQKEVRQLWPLIWSLMLAMFAVWLLAGIVIALTNEASREGAMLPILPVLFACGAGAMSVSQEKESKTLLFLTGLPIPSLRIVTVKLFVGLVLLLALWAAWAAIALSVVVDHVDTWLSLGLVSIWLLIAGHLSAWFFRSAMPALIGLVGIAALLPMGENLLRFVRREFFNDYSLYTNHAVTASGLIYFMIPAGVIAVYVVARRRLRPEPPPRLSAQESVATAAYAPPRFHGPTGWRLSALVWQRVTEQRGILLAFSLLGLVAILYGCLSTKDAGRDASLAILLVAITSWLGVCAYCGDGSARRARFLSDRGVPPPLFWWSRHLVPLGILSIGICVFTVLTISIADPSEGPRFAHEPALSMLTVTMLSLFIYGMSQWTAMVIRQVPASAFAAPIFSAGMAGWLVYGMFGLRTPWWLVGLLALLPWIVTYKAMPRYLDGRLGWRSLLVQAGVLALMVLTPFAFAGWHLLQVPGVPRAVHQDILAAAYKVPNPSGGTSRIDDYRNWIDSNEIQEIRDRKRGFSLSDAQGLLTELQRDQDEVEAFWANPDTPLEELRSETISGNAYIRPRLSDAVLAWESEPNDTEALAGLNETLRFVAGIATCWRSRTSLSWQILADNLEIAITQVVALEGVAEVLDEATRKRLLETVGDAEYRNSQRRNAVLIEYRRLQAAFDEDGLAMGPRQFMPALRPPPVELGIQWSYNRQRLAYLRTLLELVKVGQTDGDVTPQLRQLHSLSDLYFQPFDNGAYGNRIRYSRDHDIGIRLHTMERYHGNQWYAGWERLAESILNEVAADE
ncbi:MAG: hypothetical protein AAGD07_14550 [Planctomycetota bacterium]